MKFYHFSQNNSGGSFHVDDNVSHHVIIEARNADAANNAARHIGIYFNGCDSDIDCPCCGDRWYPVSEYDGEYKPAVYGNTDLEAVVADDIFTPPGEPAIIVYRADGYKQTYCK